MEAVDIRQNYVIWLQPQLDNDLEFVDEDIPMEETNFETAEDVASGEPELDEPCSEEGIGEQLETVVQHSVLSYPKSASLPNVPLRIIVQACGASQFFKCVKDYIRGVRSQGTHLSPVVEHDKFNVFKRATLHLGSPFDPDDEILDVIRATPKRGQGPLIKLGNNSFFDTVLIRGHQGPPTVAQLKVLFTLPSTIDPYRTQPLLAYVEWFTPFQRSRHDRATFLYKVSKLI
ncbi:hypothetical protein FRC05_009478, partial [Tulasnella sp. 425]